MRSNPGARTDAKSQINSPRPRVKPAQLPTSSESNPNRASAKATNRRKAQRVKRIIVHKIVHRNGPCSTQQNRPSRNVSPTESSLAKCVQLLESLVGGVHLSQSQSSLEWLVERALKPTAKSHVLNAVGNRYDLSRGDSNHHGADFAWLGNCAL